MAKQKVDDREERLSRICGAINKSAFGGENEDAVTWLGSRDTISIERFSSGCPRLDEALGGGWPKGRFIEVFGPESGGKCVTDDTYVWGKNGLMTVSEMFSRANKSATCTTKVEECRYGIAGEDSRKMEETTHFTWNGRRPVRRLLTSSGLELKGTMNQPVKVISPDGVPSWKNMQDITHGDAIVVVCGMMIDPPSNGYDEDDAALLALVIAEGHVTNNRIGFTNSNAGMLETFESLMFKKFGFTNIRKYQKKNEKTGVVTWGYNCNSKELVSDFVGRYGGGFMGCSGDKYVPYCIRTAPLFAQIEFLRYYFLSEGSSDTTRSRIEMSSKSRILIRQVQMMAMNIGSFGRIGSKTVNGEVYWRITFDGSAAEIWQDNVSMSTLYPEKAVVVQNHTGRTVYGSKRMAGEIIKDCSDSDRALHDIFEGSLSGKCDITEAVWMLFSSVRSGYQFGVWANALIGYIDEYLAKGWDVDIVSSIEDAGAVSTFDVVKPDHTFWGSGIVCHNSSLCLHALAEHQKKYPDEDCGFLDVEFSFDEEYAKNLGVNTKYLIVHQPESGEQALNILKMLIHNGVSCIVVDSVAALTTKAEMDGDIGDSHVAEQARLMSGALKQLTAEAGKRGATVFWTNQIREKIGICFQYHVPVLLADGTTEWIGNIVNNKMPVKVMSYNQKTGRIEPRKITGWFNNGVLGKDDEFIRLRAAGNTGQSKGGNRTITCTKNHIIFTPTGEVEADTLKVGDLVLVNDWKYYTPEQHEILLGSILGDGGLRFEKNSPRGHMRFLHGPNQAEYCKWKAKVFGEKANTAKSGNVWFDTYRTQEMEEYNAVGKKKGVRSFPDGLVPKITKKAVAIWYQDDGNYSGTHEKWGWGKCTIGAQCLSEHTLSLISSHLDKIGLGEATVREGCGLAWYGKEARKFQMGIARYVHPSMRYKIKHNMPEFNWNIKKMNPVEIGYPRMVTKKEYWTPPSGRRGLFDIEVDGHHSYIAGGIVVHNSYGDKTTTPAGRALKHYASIRAHIRAIGKVKEKIRGEDVIVCSRNKVDVKKNKVAPPFKTVEFCISFGHGIDIIADVLDTAIAMRIVEKRGAWFSFDGQQIGQGRAASLDLMRNTPDLVKKINDKIAEAKAAGVKLEVADDVELQDPNAGGDPDAIGEASEGAEVQDV